MGLDSENFSIKPRLGRVPLSLSGRNDTLFHLMNGMQKQLGARYCFAAVEGQLPSHGLIDASALILVSALTSYSARTLEEEISSLSFLKDSSCEEVHTQEFLVLKRSRTGLEI